MLAVPTRPFWLDVKKFPSYIKPCQRKNPKKAHSSGSVPSCILTHLQKTHFGFSRADSAFSMHENSCWSPGSKTRTDLLPSVGRGLGEIYLVSVQAWVFGAFKLVL